MKMQSLITKTVVEVIKLQTTTTNKVHSTTGDDKNGMK
jgi:hypothetical protein